MGTKRKPGKFDCYKAAGKDEPIFTLRGNDPLAADIVRDWAARRSLRLMFEVGNGTITPARRRRVERKIKEAMKCAAQMRMWVLSSSIKTVKNFPKTRARTK